MKKSKKISDLIKSNDLQKLADRARQETFYDKKVRENLKNTPKLKLDKKMALKDIKDIDEMNVIYYEYLQSNYTTVCERIAKYDEFTFFHDLVIFLSFGIRQEKERTRVYREIVEFYINQLTETENGKEGKDN
jgi:rubrerythrin